MNPFNSQFVTLIRFYYICKSDVSKKSLKGLFIPDNNSDIMKLIELHLQKIIELCKIYKVKSLAVFGSILTNRFNEQSDVDFLVNFEPYDPDKMDFDYVTNYFDLKNSLEILFNRKVDLIEDGSQLNPYFRYCINKKKQQIYG